MSSFVDSAEFERLLERIAVNDPYLTEVDLELTNIGDAGTIRLAEALRGNTVINGLFLRYSSIGDDGARALAEVLRHNSSLTVLDLEETNIRHEGWIAFSEMLHVNSTITLFCMEANNIDEELYEKIDELVVINDQAPNPEEAHRRKVELRIGWMLDFEGGSEYGAAVTLALAELGNFPEADRRRGLFERLLGSVKRGMDVAASTDAAGGRVLYWYAAECGAARVVLMNLLRAHPSLCACRDVKQKLFPFMLLATMEEAEAGDVMEALLENPFLVKGGIGMPDNNCASKPERVDASGK